MMEYHVLKTKQLGEPHFRDKSVHDFLMASQGFCQTSENVISRLEGFQIYTLELTTLTHFA